MYLLNMVQTDNSSQCLIYLYHHNILDLQLMNMNIMCNIPLSLPPIPSSLPNVNRDAFRIDNKVVNIIIIDFMVIVYICY